MLKSTYQKSTPTVGSEPAPLPPGWVEHMAPTGHPYYYHAETQTSTYTRPTAPSEEPLAIDYGATEPDHVVRASMQVMDEFHRNNNPAEPGHFTGGRSYQDHSRRRGNQGDRPKSKTPIPSCQPWVLVKTQKGRRFVHNTETKQSLWKFPQDVMMAVIEMETLEWKAKKAAEENNGGTQKSQPPEEGAQSGDQGGPQPNKDQTTIEEYDSDSYEEVEVTDDDVEERDHSAAKRPRISQDDNNNTTPPPTGPVEFNEDDIAWQLAQMEGNYSDQYDEDGERDMNPEVDEGIPLTATDNIALFRSLLDDSGVSPYSVFEKVIEDMSIVEDSRYTALPNTSSRKEAFAQWSKDRIAMKKQQEQEQATLESQQSSTSASTLAAKDPKIQYLRLLHRHATPKLYWPEFKRKYKRESAMTMKATTSFPEKDREKLYREYISKLKLSDSERRKLLVEILKATEIDHHSVRSVADLPLEVQRDLRLYLLEERRREELVMTFLETGR
ncbi:hypothetical protein LTR84_004617 [Exophiala bonariae]|uniref:WW domain-containing protein n=1 Tax=Exophiala bonariae TaxID=1690606 RepID=A0AAV9NMN7_9EURO|nr:hypothetical protein LTR84_004617 [Exophiala bonariae]